MRAVMIRKFGGPEVLELAEVPHPYRGMSRSLIQVHAASVNPVDWRIRDGAAKRYVKATFPTILGCDLAGVVAQVRGRVSNFVVGDRVFAMMRHDWGAQAELVALAEGLVVRLPSGLSMEEATALPVPGLTALRALRTRGKLQAGQRVLINGGSSSVGMAAVQIAATDGANVTAVCGQDSFGMLTALGATELIDYRTTDFAAGPAKYDLIFDCIGNKPHSACKGVINSRGAHVTTTPRGAVAPPVLPPPSARACACDCGRRVPEGSPGRTRLYASRACQQRAYRERRQPGDQATLGEFMNRNTAGAGGDQREE